MEEDGSKKFQVGITIRGHLERVMKSQATKECCKIMIKKILQNSKPKTLWSNNTPQWINACWIFFNGKTFSLIEISILVQGRIVNALILELYSRPKANPNPKLANIGKYYCWAISIFVKTILILVFNEYIRMILFWFLIPHKWHGESSYGSNFPKTKIILVPILKIKLGFGSSLAHLDCKPMVNYQLAPHFKRIFSK